MKKKFLLLIPLVGLLFGGLTSVAQTEEPIRITTAEEKPAPNMVKFNVLTLLGGKFSFEYERALTKRVAVGAALSFRPSKGLPFSSTVKKFVDDEELDALIDGFQSSNFSITPEVRFYLSKRGPFRGFYLAPYAKYATYTASLPFDFEVEVDYEDENYSFRTETIPLKGDVSTFSAGLSMGVNFKLSKSIYLDWRIFGPGYGSAKGNVVGQMNLTQDEVDGLNEELAGFKEDLADLPMGIKLDYKVTTEGAELTINRSPWAAIRSGLSIAYRF